MIPDSIPQSTSRTVEAIIGKCRELTIENRIYADRVDGSDLPEDERIRADNNDRQYYVDGEQPMFGEYAVGVEDGDVRLGAEFNSLRGHWANRDFAGEFYDICETHGVSRPTDDPTVGVQFGANGSVAVENVIEGGENE